MLITVLCCFRDKLLFQRNHPLALPLCINHPLPTPQEKTESPLPHPLKSLVDNWLKHSIPSTKNCQALYLHTMGVQKLEDYGVIPQAHQSQVNWATCTLLMKKNPVFFRVLYDHLRIMRLQTSLKEYLALAMLSTMFGLRILRVLVMVLMGPNDHPLHNTRYNQTFSPKFRFVQFYRNQKFHQMLTDIQLHRSDQ